MADGEEDIITNISQPPSDTLKLFFLQRQNDALESIRAYLTRKAHSGRGPTVGVKANVQALFYDLQPHLKTRYKKEETFNALKEKVFNKDVEKVIEAYEDINQFLYDLNLKRVDTRKKYDTTNVEEENNAVNL